MRRGPIPKSLGTAISELEQQSLTLVRSIAVLQHELYCIHADLAVLKRERSQ